MITIESYDDAQFLKTLVDVMMEKLLLQVDPKSQAALLAFQSIGRKLGADIVTLNDEDTMILQAMLGRAETAFTDQLNFPSAQLARELSIKLQGTRMQS